eukprot:NODE_29_length_33183_cov_0.333666.p22 type:complete len:164 gc:universal NODE_29_length_33183_cov_0.333666:14954-14463(-)
MMICKWEDCYKTFKEQDEILGHVEGHVGYPKRNTFKPHCKWAGCNVRKNTRGAMVSHIAVHIDVRPFPCKCGKSFKRKYDRIVHQRKCNDEKIKVVEFKDPLKEIISQVELGRKALLISKDGKRYSKEGLLAASKLYAISRRLPGAESKFSLQGLNSKYKCPR